MDNSALYPERKPMRLPGMRYSENGAYFVTICSRNKDCIFWDVGAALRRPPEALNSNGLIVMREIERIGTVYQGVVCVDNHVVMPNHVHLLLSIHPEKTGGRRNAAPTISSVVNQFKGAISKAVGFPCWQKSFYDHIVRNEAEYQRIWEYIDANPGKWEEDRYYLPCDEQT